MKTNRNRLFKNVGSVNPGKSVFNLSYEKKFTCDMGQLIPVMCDEVVPGDFFEIGSQAVIRFQPLVAPVLHEINMYVHYFFVPFRILWDEWETFITRGIDGDQEPAIPEWDPTSFSEGSLWDFLGFPIDIDCDGVFPVAFPMYAYNTIYNEYYRDENLVTEVDIDQEEILNRAWEKDYFTSALLEQQRGTAPALPIDGTTSADFTSAVSGTSPDNASNRVQQYGGSLYMPGGTVNADLLTALNKNTVDLSVASTFDIADLRLAFQIQKWMERNNRAGARYTEFLRSHFGVSPRDDRLQRPEYIGGAKSPVIVSEVLQTSSTDVTTPQGNMAGHAIGVNDAYCGKYHVKEYGLIMGIMSVMPKPAYQQGINKQWLKKTSYDYYFPEFAHLSEQAIINAELCVKDNDSAYNNSVFGYAGRYDEMRIKQNMVCSGMRDTFDYWHLGRIFDPGSLPALNDSFITCVPDKRIFAVESDPGLIVSFANIIKAIRPLPIIAEPGLVDHN